MVGMTPSDVPSPDDTAPRAPRQERPPVGSFVWGFTPGSHALSVTRDERRLLVLVSELPEGALTVAMEGPRTADTEALSADYAYRVVAERATLKTGKRRGERFARDCLAGDADIHPNASVRQRPPRKRR
jgi:hypothetical protein